MIGKAICVFLIINVAIYNAGYALCNLVMLRPGDPDNFIIWKIPVFPIILIPLIVINCIIILVCLHDDDEENSEGDKPDEEDT